MRKQSFEPIVPHNPRILILGSLPGDLSITHQQYYGHPQNRFWKILFHLYKEEYTNEYTQKIELLHKYQIALWDVCATAIRPGSMDTNITEVIPNPIPTFIEQNPLIKHVFFNGQKAEKLYKQYLHKLANIDYSTLPSTSPANARFSFEKLISAWQIIRQK